MSQTTKKSAAIRIEKLLDDNSFVEVGSYVTARSTDFNMAETETPGDGVITGYGTIGGCLVYVYSQDNSVLGGSMGEMHAKKIVNICDQAMKMGAPIIGLIDCAGLRLQEATDALDAFGKIYLSQTMASGVIPQIQAVFGNCGGGMAVSTALADFTFMESEKASLFVSAPNTLDGNYIDILDTSSAKYQSETTGLVDGTGTEDEVIEQIKTLVSVLPANNEDDMSYDECTDDLNRAVDIAGCVEDAALALSYISDNNFFFSVKKNFAPEMVTAFIRLNGQTIGCVANTSKYFDEDGNVALECDKTLTAKGARKATEFIDFCDAFQIPVLTLVNVKGYVATKGTEKHMAKAAARLTYAFANATVPKVSVIVGDAFGSAYLSMNSKSIGADMVYAWPQAKIGMMDAREAARIIYEQEIEASDDQVATINAYTNQYNELQSSAISAARRGYVDDIIDPAQTRQRLIAAFEMLFTKREDRPAKKHGTI